MTLGNMCLMIVTVIVIITGALMALLVGLVLPREFLDEYHMEGIDYHHDQRALDISQEDKKEPNYYITERNRRRKYNGLSEFSWLVSVNLPRYDDDENLLWFACTGTVVSADKVLVGDACFRKPFNVPKDYILNEGRVRSKSAYFSKEGHLHEIKDIHSSKGLSEPYCFFFLLIVEDLDCNVVNLPSHDVKWTTSTKAIAVGWGGNKIAHADVLKYERFHHEKWSVINDDKINAKLCRECGNAPSRKEACYMQAKLQYKQKDSRINGRPLVTGDPDNLTLLGIQMDYVSADNSTTFIDMRFVDFKNWIENPNGDKIETILSDKTKDFFMYREIDSYTFCLEKERDEYLARYFLEQKQSLESEESTRSIDGNQTHEIEKRKSSNEPNLRAKKSSNNLDRNLQKFGAIRTAELADTERQKLASKSSTATIVSVDNGLTSVSHTFYPSSSIPIVTSDGSTILGGFSKFPSTSEAFLGVLRILNEKTETAGKGSLSVDEVAIDAIYSTGTQVYEQSISIETITSSGGVELITEDGSETEKLDVDKLFTTESKVDEIITSVVTSEETYSEDILQTISESIIIATMSSVKHGPTDVSGRFNFPSSNLNISSSGSVFDDGATSNDTMQTKKSHPIEFTPRISVISSEKTTLGGAFDSVDSLHETENTGKSDSTSEISRETTYTMPFIAEELTARSGTSEFISRRPSESTEVTGTSSKATVESITIDMMPTRESVFSSVYTSVTPVMSSQRKKFSSDDRTTALKIIDSGHSERKEDTSISDGIKSLPPDTAIFSERDGLIDNSERFFSADSTSEISILPRNGNSSVTTERIPGNLVSNSTFPFPSSEGMEIGSGKSVEIRSISIDNIFSERTEATGGIGSSELSATNITKLTELKEIEVGSEVREKLSTSEFASKNPVISSIETHFNTERSFESYDQNTRTMYTDIELTREFDTPQYSTSLEKLRRIIEFASDDNVSTRDISSLIMSLTESEVMEESRSTSTTSMTGSKGIEVGNKDSFKAGDTVSGEFEITEKFGSSVFASTNPVISRKYIEIDPSYNSEHINSPRTSHKIIEMMGTNSVTNEYMSMHTMPSIGSDSTEKTTNNEFFHTICSTSGEGTKAGSAVTEKVGRYDSAPKKIITSNKKTEYNTELGFGVDNINKKLRDTEQFGSFKLATTKPIISSRGTEFTESSTKTYITNAMPSEEMKEIEITGKFSSRESTTMLQTSIKIIETNGDDRVSNEDMSSRTIPSVLFDKSESQFTSSTLLPPSNVTESITEATTVASVDTVDYVDIKVSNISQHTTPKTPNEKTKVGVEVTEEFNRYDVASKNFLKSVRRTKFNPELRFGDDDVNMKIESTSNMYIPESADTLETSSETIVLNGDNGIPTRDITIHTKFSAEYETIKKSRSYKSSNTTLVISNEETDDEGVSTTRTSSNTSRKSELAKKFGVSEFTPTNAKRTSSKGAEFNAKPSDGTSSTDSMPSEEFEMTGKLNDLKSSTMMQMSTGNIGFTEQVTTISDRSESTSASTESTDVDIQSTPTIGEIFDSILLSLNDTNELDTSTEYEPHISSGDDTEGTIRATEKTSEGTFSTSDTISTTSFTSNYRSALINDDNVNAGIKLTRAISTVKVGINDKYDSGILLIKEAGKPYVNTEINSLETHVESDIHHGLETVYNDDFNTESRAAPSTDLEIGTLSSYTASRNESKSISHDVVTDTDSNLFEVNRSSEFDGSIESSVFAAETSDEKTRSMRTIGIEIHSDIKHRPDTEFSDASRNSSGSNSSKIMIGENPGVIKEVVSSTVTDMGGDIVLRTDNSTVDDARDKEIKV